MGLFSDWAERSKELQEQFKKGEVYSLNEIQSISRYVKTGGVSKRGRPKKS